jgi:hypothetical protein
LRRESILRALAIGHLVAAAGIYVYWIGFYTGITFPGEALAHRIPYFDAWVAFEKAFTLPDVTTASVCAFAALRLFRDPSDRTARSLIVGASGALMFLATLDVSYDLRNGMYDLGAFSVELIGPFLGVPLLGFLGAATIALLARGGAEGNVGSTDARRARPPGRLRAHAWDQFRSSSGDEYPRTSG